MQFRTPLHKWRGAYLYLLPVHSGVTVFEVFNLLEDVIHNTDLIIIFSSKG